MDPIVSTTAFTVADHQTNMEKTCILFPLKTFHLASLS